MRSGFVSLAIVLVLLAAAPVSAQTDVFDRVTHGYATSEGGVKIHYATLGEGAAGGDDPRLPGLLVLVAPPDGRAVRQVPGRRDRSARLQPERQADRASRTTTCGCWSADVAAVIRHLGRDKATIVGHDWGGMVAWQFAMNLPQMTENLIILNLPHPNGLLRELQSNPEQIKNSEYARNFQRHVAEGSDGLLRPADDGRDAIGVGEGPGGAQALRRGVSALGLRRDAELLQAQLPDRRPAPTCRRPPQFPKVKAPVLMFHGLDDQALHSDGLSGTWNWVEKDLTLVTIPGAGHFVQQDAADLVTSTMRSWLDARNR